MNDLTVTLGARATREDRPDHLVDAIIKDSGNAPGAESGRRERRVSRRLLSNDARLARSMATTRVDQLTSRRHGGHEVLRRCHQLRPRRPARPIAHSLTNAQRAQVAAAKAIRRTAIGVVFPTREAEAFKETQPAFVVSPSYKINDDLTSAMSPGSTARRRASSQFVNGVSSLVPGEKTSAYEIGLQVDAAR